MLRFYQADQNPAWTSKGQQRARWQMLQGLIIIGRSGNALDILDIVEAVNSRGGRWSVEGILDDRARAGTSFSGVDILGPLSCATDLGGRLFINGIGSDKSHRQRRSILATTGLGAAKFASIVHPAASISKGAKLGRGVSAGPGVCVGRNASVGDHVWLGAGAIIGHDSVIEDYCVVAPGAVISGAVHVGPSSYVGAGAVIRQNLEVGPGALVGMGAVVTRSVAAEATVYGNPARPHGHDDAVEAT